MLNFFCITQTTVSDGQMNFSAIFPRLRSMHLKNCDITNMNALVQAYPNLNSINLYIGNMLTPMLTEDFLHFARMNTQIQHLALNMYHDPRIWGLIFKELPNLETVQLSYVPSVVQYFNGQPIRHDRVRNFVVTSNQAVSNLIRPANVFAFPNLTYFSVSCDTSDLITGGWMDFVHMHPTIKHLQLACVQIANIDEIEKALVFMRPPYPPLVEVKMFNAFPYNEGLFEFFEKYYYLKRMSLLPWKIPDTLELMYKVPPIYKTTLIKNDFAIETLDTDFLIIEKMK